MQGGEQEEEEHLDDYDYDHYSSLGLYKSRPATRFQSGIRCHLPPAPHCHLLNIPFKQVQLLRQRLRSNLAS